MAVGNPGPQVLLPILSILPFLLPQSEYRIATNFFADNFWKWRIQFRHQSFQPPKLNSSSDTDAFCRALRGRDKPHKTNTSKIKTLCSALALCKWNHGSWIGDTNFEVIRFHDWASNGFKLLAAIWFQHLQVQFGDIWWFKAFTEIQKVKQF